jgi:hypothetical protein
MSRCVVTILLTLLAGCAATKPDVMMEMVYSLCPDDETRTRIQGEIQTQLTQVKDPDVHDFLATAQVEDNVLSPLGKCPKTGCQCSNNEFRLGIWRSSATPHADRVTALVNAPKIVPSGQTFGVHIEGSFLEDLVAFKWSRTPKRYNSSSHAPDPNGSVELTSYKIDYPSPRALRLVVNGTFSGVSFTLTSTDIVATTPAGPKDLGMVSCTTDKHAAADTTILDGLAAFFLPFGIERLQRGGQKLEDLLGITAGLDDGQDLLTVGPACATTPILPTWIPIPRSFFGSPDVTYKLDFDYASPSLDSTGLLATANLSLNPREPSLSLHWTYKDTAGDFLLFATPETGEPRILVNHLGLAQRRAEKLLTAVGRDMRDPQYTWRVEPVSWDAPATTLTGAMQQVVFPLWSTALPGDQGTGWLSVTAIDANGLFAQESKIYHIQILNCCDSDMFIDYFNTYCARIVGTNRERCDVYPDGPNP